MKRIPKKVSRDALLKLPVRKWDQPTLYDNIYVVPSRKKHDSGWMLQAIVGVSYGDACRTAEIAAYCDDICWSFPLKHPYDYQGKHKSILRTDCEFPSGILRFWASSEHYFRGRFRVGCSLSSTDIELVLEPVGDAQKLTSRLAELAIAND